jgi:hypothetical protein
VSSRVLDRVALALSVLPGAVLWGSDRGAALQMSGDLPRWATFRDALLVGPDAGAWASSANALFLGRYEDLDAHRLPVLPRLIALVMNFQPDVALAGHLLNHLLHLALGPVVFLLGRRWMGAGAALGASLVACTFQPTVFAADRYGVDPLVTLLLPLALLAADVAAERPKWSPLLGIVVGIASSAHLTTIGIGVPALTLTFLSAGREGWGFDGRRRAQAAVGLLLGTLLGVFLVFWRYPVLPWGLFTGSLAEGVAPGAGMANQAQLAETSSTAAQVVRGGLPGAASAAIGWLLETIWPARLPWLFALLLPWLGVLGLGLDDAERMPRGSGALAGLRVGIPLLGALVPLVAFASAGSPLRYSANYQALGCLLVFRGLASCFTMVRVLIVDGPRRSPPLARVVRRVPPELPTLLFAVTVAAMMWDRERVLAPLKMPPSSSEIADRELGLQLKARFPGGGGGFCARREVMAYAGRVYCPQTLVTPGAGSVAQHLAKECGGTGPIPFVVTSEPLDHGTAPLAPTISWVQANVPVADEFRSSAYTATIYAIERP